MIFRNKYLTTAVLSAIIITIMILVKNIVSILFLSFMIGFFIYSISIYVRKIFYSDLISIIISSFIFVMIIAGIILFIFPFATNELQPILQDIIPKISLLINKYRGILNIHIKSNQSISDFVNSSLENLFNSTFNTFSVHLKTLSMKITSIASKAIVVIVLGFLSAIERHVILDFFVSLFPFSKKKAVLEYVNQITMQLYQYIKLQISICFIFSVYYAINFKLIGLPFELGIFIGIMSLLPYIGFGLGIGLSFMILISKDVSTFYYIFLTLVFVGSVLIENLIIMPVLVKGRLGLNPIYVICSMMLIEKFLGVLWLVFSFPICIILKFLIMLIIDKYKETDYYKKD